MSEYLGETLIGNYDATRFFGRRGLTRKGDGNSFSIPSHTPTAGVK